MQAWDQPHPEDAAIDAARAELPPVTFGTARPWQLVEWLTNHAQAYARAYDANSRASEEHHREQIDRLAEEILYRMTQAGAA
jgi:hypothetical protein